MHKGKVDKNKNLLIMKRHYVLKKTSQKLKILATHVTPKNNKKKANNTIEKLT